jgi:hypothetical protein
VLEDEESSLLSLAHVEEHGIRCIAFSLPTCSEVDSFSPPAVFTNAEQKRPFSAITILKQYRFIRAPLEIHGAGNRLRPVGN